MHPQLRGPTAVANSQNANYAREYVTNVKKLLDARDALKSLRERSATGIVETITVEDLASLVETAHLPSKQVILDAFPVMDGLESLFTDFGTTPPTPKPALLTLLKFRP
jgi:hypothetical protein